MDDATMVASSLWKIIIHLEIVNLQEVEGRERYIYSS
jgi:hypothetical protein